MQPVCRSCLAPARPQPEVPRARAGAATATACQARATTTSRVCVCVWRAAPARRLRANTPRGGGTTEPVEPRKDGPPSAVDQAEEAGLAPEELEVLEEAAIMGEDEGRRPTDYDRRAHIFEESSRVFRDLKQRSDGDGGGGSESQSGRGGGVTTGPAAETANKDV